MRSFDDSHERPAGPARRRPATGRAAEPGGPTAAGLLHLQRAAGNAAVARSLDDAEAESPVKKVVGRGGGQALDDDTRAFMESRLGQDFSGVRVHTDAAAAASAAAVQANAYTVGHDVVFGSGRYSPGTDDGRRMLAHELVHVAQQSAGPVEGTPAPGGIRLSDPSDRFERAAEETADRVMAGERAGPAAGDAPRAPVQRQEEEPAEEEGMQLSAVQRQEGPEEEEPEVG